jgi:8-oxo-dGTP pyrophosphatase MutT (NUDIX family)
MAGGAAGGALQKRPRVSAVRKLALSVLRICWWLLRPRTIGARAVVVDSSGSVLLVRHSYGTLWYLPGGGVKKGEGPATGLQRELREEVGIENAVIDGVVGLYHSRREYKDDYVAVYSVALDPAQAAQVRACSAEIAQIGFFPPAELPAEVSPATRRRISERFGARTYSDAW